MISLTCYYHPGAPESATIHHVREILSFGTHVTSSQKTKRVEAIFGRKSGKNLKLSLLPSAKSRRESKIKTLGVTFRGISAYYVQALAPQKQADC